MRTSLSFIFVQSLFVQLQLILTSECSEAILVKFCAESEPGQKEVGEDEDGSDADKERSPPVHQEEGEDQEPGCK